MVGTDRTQFAVKDGENVASARWASDEEIARFSYSAKSNSWIGTHNGKKVGYEDDRHELLFAGTRGGKGRSCIVPRLMEYPKSAWVIDPKGELAELTAERRGKGSDYVEGMGQKVAVLDPFNEAKNLPPDYRAIYNPIEFLPNDSDEGIEQAETMASCIVVDDGKGDPFWPKAERKLIYSLILHVKSWKYIPDDERDLIKVRELLKGGDKTHKESKIRFAEKKLRELRAQLLDLESPDDPDDFDEMTLEALNAETEEAEGYLNYLENRPAFDFLIDSMSANRAYHDEIHDFAENWKRRPANTKESILEGADGQVSFLKGKMAKVLRGESTFKLSDLRQTPEGFTLYLVLPARLLPTNGAWLRLMLAQTINTFEGLGGIGHNERRTLFVLEECATLGHMALLEKYVGLIAGYGVKLWCIYQNISQLKANYRDSWETFLGNVGIIQAFSLRDKMTTEYLSAIAGKFEMERERTSTSTSTTEGTSETTGESEGFAPGANFGGDAERAQEAMSRNARQNEFIKTGASMGQSTSTSTTENTSTSFQFTQSNLINPDEIAVMFNRDNKTQLVFIDGQRPMILDRENYDDYKWFRGKYNNGQKLKTLELEGKNWIDTIDKELPRVEEKEKKLINQFARWIDIAHYCLTGALLIGLLCAVLAFFLEEKGGYYIAVFCGALCWFFGAWGTAIEQQGDEEVDEFRAQEFFRHCEFFKAYEKSIRAKPLELLRAWQSAPDPTKY